MPTRLIRDGILDSDRVNSLSEREELFYRKLHSVADDYGLFDARAPILKSKMYALRPSVRETDMTLLLAACEKAGLIAQYSDNGKMYGVILDFGQQQKGKPKHPMPPLTVLGLEERKEGVYRSYSRIQVSVTPSNSQLLPVTPSKPIRIRNSDAKCEMRNADTPQPPKGAEVEQGEASGYDGLPGFCRFWDAYPARGGVRQGKAEAAKVWQRAKLERHADKIVAHVEAMAKTEDWRKDQGRFAPQARTYLNQRRWEDEIDPTAAMPSDRRNYGNRPQQRNTVEPDYTKETF